MSSQFNHSAKIAFLFHFSATFMKENVLATYFYCNSGKFLFVPYTKGFGRITHFLGNDLATVLYTAFFLDLLFK